MKDAGGWDWLCPRDAQGNSVHADLCLDSSRGRSGAAEVGERWWKAGSQTQVSGLHSQKVSPSSVPPGNLRFSKGTC